MRDARKQIVAGLIALINAKISGVTVYTIVPKTAAYPYIYISDIYQTDESSKNEKHYDYETLIQVVYKDIVSKVDLWSKMNSVVSIINTRKDLVLTDNFTCEYLHLLQASEEEVLTDTGRLHIGLIRFKIVITDKN